MFIDNIKDGLIVYLKDNDININITDLYVYGHDVKAPELQIGVIDNSTYDRAATFSRETIKRMPIQIVVYSGQMLIGGKKYSSLMACEHIANLIIKWFEDNKTKIGVSMLRRKSVSTSLPLSSGTNLYYKVLRYDIHAQDLKEI